MTTSTFSLAISPPLFRWDMRHIGDAQRLVAFHRAVDDVHGVSPKHGIDRCARRSGPAFNLVLPHPIDKCSLIRGRKLPKIPPKDFMAALVDRGNCGAVELRERRTEVENASLQESFVRRHRELLIDKVCDPGLARLRYQRLAQRLEGFTLMGIEKPEWDATRPGFAGRHDDFCARYRNCQRTQGRALHEATPANARHCRLLPDFFASGKCTRFLGFPASRKRNADDQCQRVL